MRIVLTVIALSLGLYPAISPGQRPRAVGFGPVPLWPQAGDVEAYPTQSVFFNPAGNEYIVAYPAGKPLSKRTVLHVPSHRMVEPAASVEVTELPDGKFRYTYTIRNGSQARTSIGSVLLVLEPEASLTTAHSHSWTSLVSRGRPVGVALSAGGTVEWRSKSGSEITRGSERSDFTITSDLSPGFTLMSFRGESKLPELEPLIIAKLPLDVQEQLTRCKSLTWDTQVRQILGPRFIKQTPQSAIAANFGQGLHRQGAVPNRAVTEFLKQLNTILSPVIEGSATINPEGMNALRATATAEQQKTLSALQMTLAHSQGQ